MGGSIARIADPHWPKGYSTPYNVMAQYINWRSWVGAGSLLRDGLVGGW